MRDQGFKSAAHERRLLARARQLGGSVQQCVVDIERGSHMHEYAHFMHTPQSLNDAADPRKRRVVQTTTDAGHIDQRPVARSAELHRPRERRVLDALNQRYRPWGREAWSLPWVVGLWRPGLQDGGASDRQGSLADGDELVDGADVPHPVDQSRRGERAGADVVGVQQLELRTGPQHERLPIVVGHEQLVVHDDR